MEEFDESKFFDDAFGFASSDDDPLDASACHQRHIELLALQSGGYLQDDQGDDAQGAGDMAPVPTLESILQFAAFSRLETETSQESFSQSFQAPSTDDHLFFLPLASPVQSHHVFQGPDVSNDAP